ncbi:Uncharacterised protein [Salmonella enterica subsp. enterica serovar Bovismorbificans]|nr:Uncharacterised protein [Salmonella enterica subsp. enterica serovar Bovismorbificans]
MAEHQFTSMAVYGADGKSRQFLVRNGYRIFDLIRQSTQPGA